MPTYEYECTACTLRFERRQSMADAPVELCPRCEGRVRRVVSGGTGVILKGEGQAGAASRNGSCSLETTGRTCCGRDERCEKPPCGE